VKGVWIYVKKPVHVEARQATEREGVLTANGPVVAEPGDWIVTNRETGDTWPVKGEYFERDYEKVGYRVATEEDGG
jgi:hypothetical protein